MPFTFKKITSGMSKTGWGGVEAHSKRFEEMLASHTYMTVSSQCPTQVWGGGAMFKLCAKEGNIFFFLMWNPMHLKMFLSVFLFAKVWDGKVKKKH